MKTRKIIKILFLSLLVIFTLAYVPIMVQAVKPTGEQFSATLSGSGPSGDPKHFWTDKKGISHVRGIPSITSISGSITGTVELMQNADLDGTWSMGDIFAWGTITLDGEERPYYRIRMHVTVTDGDISGFFIINGKGERIVGSCNGILGGDAVLTGTWYHK